ncbi:MAG: hypothetical protein K6C94_09855 [Candidatus Gastranaerophilales bacterium]|nr:hypothetical protein [Candidatus Gastranaerophilales bacterium]
MQFDEKALKNYKEVIIGILIIILLAAFGIKQVVGATKKMQTTNMEHRKEKEKLKEINKKVLEYEEAKKKIEVQQNKIKPVFDAGMGSEDSMAAFGGMFEDITEILKTNKLMLRSIAYQISPSTDPIFSKFPSLYSVCQVDYYVVATYTDLQGALRDLTVYPYFINVSEVKITPYDKNPQYILLNMSITLYAKKQQSASSVMN